MIQVNGLIYFFQLEGKSVLDFGCGVGAKVHLFRAYGIDAWGVDISEYAREHAIGLAKNHIKEKITGEYDLIISMDVFEHINDEDLEILMPDIVKASNLFYVGITFIDNPNFPKDETHINGKTREEWREFLSKYYDVVQDAPDFLYAHDMHFICVNKK